MNHAHISVNVVDGVTVVKFRDLARNVFHSEAEIHEIGSELQGLLDEIQPCSLVLDFESKEFISFAAFDARLVSLQRKVTQRNGTLKLCNLAPGVAQMFKVNGLTDYLCLYNSLEDALVASKSGG